MLSIFNKPAMSKQPLKFIWRFSLIIVLASVTFELLSREKSKLKFNPKPVTNHQIQIESLTEPDRINILDPMNGTLEYTGWGTNLESRFIVNHKDASIKPLGKKLTWLNYRAFDFFMIYSEDHVFTIPLANFASACSTSINIFPKSDLISGRMRKDVLLKKCASMDLESVMLSKDFLNSSSLTIDIEKVGDQVYMGLEVKKLNFKANLVMDEENYDSQFMSMPLSNDQKHFFMNNKKFGMPIYGEYELNGQTYNCSETQHCVGMYDIGRGHFTYFTNWFWATISTVMKAEGDDEEVHFSLNMGDGLGVNYHSQEKVSPDFVNINGKHFKLDQTDLSYDEKNLYGAHYFSTHSQDKKFPDRECSLEFTPVGLAYDGLSVVFLGFKQYLMFGTYSGKCVIEGKTYAFENVLGAVEHARAKF